MAWKKLESNGKAARGCFKAISPPPSGPSPTSSARTSPGLLAGHYAGCKFTEPPSPSALPQPPKHWMQAPSTCVSAQVVIPFENHMDFSHQLKVLLKVQA